LFRYCVSISGKISAEANLCDTGSAADLHSLGLQDALAAVCLEPWQWVRSDSMGPIGSHRKSGRFLEVHVVFTQNKIQYNKKEDKAPILRQSHLGISRRHFRLFPASRLSVPGG